MKTYVLTVSRNFPSYHKRKGDDTNFVENIFAKIKIHTIRNNYDLWKKRIDEVNKGEAVISLRYWTGKPYKAPQKEFYKLQKGDVGVQKIERTVLGWFIDDIDSEINTTTLAKNDGLSFEDFKEWFKKKVVMEGQFDMAPMAIIHFTKFRY